MVGFVLTGHGDFSRGLASALSMVAGDVAHFQTVTFNNDEAAEYPSNLRSAIESMRAECDGVLVFVDLRGGTPFNQSMLVAADVDDVEIITGTNLPMLIEPLFMRTEDATLEFLRDTALAVGKDGISSESAAALAGGAEDDLDEDGI